MSVLDTASWLVAIAGPDRGRVLRIGERRALNLDGWFETLDELRARGDDDEVRGLMVWVEDDVVLIQDCLAPVVASAEGIEIGEEPVALLCGDEFSFAGWRWRVVEMPNEVEPDPDEVRLQPRRAPLGGEALASVTSPPSSVEAGEPLPLDVTQPEPFARPGHVDLEGTPLEGRSAWFVALSGERAGEFFALGDELTFGRSPEVEVVVQHRQINRRHVGVRRERGKAIAQMMGGQNQALLNGVSLYERADSRHPLEHNDVLTLAGGDNVFIFKVLEVDASPTREQVASWITRWALQSAEQQRLTRGGRTRDRGR